MWLALIALAVGCLVGLLAGGSLWNITSSGLRWLWLLAAGAACEAVADRWMPGAAGLWLVVAGYVLMVAFALRNLPEAGSVLVAVGLCSNLLVIGLNAGMPVRGVPAGVQLGGHHHGERSGDLLAGLADVVYVAPLGETLSAGDIVLASGVGTLAAFAVVRGRRTPANRSELRARVGSGV